MGLNMMPILAQDILQVVARKQSNEKADPIAVNHWNIHIRINKDVIHWERPIHRLSAVGLPRSLRAGSADLTIDG